VTQTTIGCLGKIGYPTRAEANDAKKRLFAKAGYVKRGAGRAAVGFQVYHCAKCDRFHLGRNKRVGVIGSRRVPDHEHNSHKSRFARWQALTRESQK
jgi:hypothetical protein